MEMAAEQVRDCILKDVIFGANAACKKAAQVHGKDKVVNATIGAIMDDEGNIACIPVVEEVLRSLPIGEMISYAPIAGVPEYLRLAEDLTFGKHRPAGYIASCATPGGTGALYNAIHNYTQAGDFVLTSDWYWGSYSEICRAMGRTLTTYQLFDEKNEFNLQALEKRMDELLAKQESLLTIINTPAHNPTGYSLSKEDWAGVIAHCKAHAAKGKKIILVVDIAYIDYAGDKDETRLFMEQFANLPANIFTIFTFSMSKGYTFYGQRGGAMIGFSSEKKVIEQFSNVTAYACRATWSNCNHGAMATLVRIHQDAALRAKLEEQREALYQMIKKRAAIFTAEAAQCGLKALPYKAGFFLSVPTQKSAAVCDRLHDDLIFAVPLKAGVRLAACSVPAHKMHGVAAKILKALNEVEG